MNTYAVNYNDLENRIDPYFYRLSFKVLNNRLKKLTHKKLDDVVSLSNETWNQKDFFEKEFPYIEISEIDTLSGKIQNIAYYDKKKAPSRAKMIVRDNDIIVSTTRPHRGAISQIDKAKDGFIASTGFVVLRNLKTESINKSYLYHFLRTDLALKQMLQRSSGGNYPAITTGEIRKLIIPTPPLNTQKKIVSLMRTAYKTREEKLKQADKLLSSINNYLISKSGITISTKQRSKCFAVDSADLGGIFSSLFFVSQPTNSKNLISIKEVATINPSREKPKGRIGDKVPYVGLPETNDRKINTIILRDYKEVKGRRVTLKDDILFARIEPSVFNKKYIYVDSLEDHNYVFTSTEFLIIEANKNKINPKYLFHCLFLDSVYTQVTGKTTGSTGRRRVEKSSLEEIKIPFPSRNTQNEIADEIDNRLSKANMLKKEALKTVADAKKKVEEMILN